LTGRGIEITSLEEDPQENFSSLETEKEIPIGHVSSLGEPMSLTTNLPLF